MSIYDQQSNEDEDRRVQRHKLRPKTKSKSSLYVQNTRHLNKYTEESLVTQKLIFDKIEYMKIEEENPTSKFFKVDDEKDDDLVI